MSVLEIAAVVFSLLAIWLTARRHLLCWPLGLVSVALYGKVFFDARLYSDMLLQGLFGAAVLYGWWIWLRGQGETGEVRVVPLPRFHLLAWLVAGAGGAGALGLVMSRYTDAALPWLDATLSAFSLVAQVWTARRHTANWPLWIAVDVVYVGMFIVKDLDLTAALYAVFVGLAVEGWRRWAHAPSEPATA